MVNKVGIEIDVNSTSAQNKMKAFEKALQANDAQLRAFNRALQNNTSDVSKAIEKHLSLEKKLSKELRIYNQYSSSIDKLTSKYTSYLDKLNAEKIAQDRLKITLKETNKLKSLGIIKLEEQREILKQVAVEVRGLTRAEADQIHTLKGLTGSTAQGTAAAEQLRLKYDKQYSSIQRLKTAKSELKQITDAELIGVAKANQIYAELKSKIDITSNSRAKEIASIQKSIAKYDASYNAHLKLKQVKLDLNAAVQSGQRTREQANALMKQERDKLLGISKAKKELFNQEVQSAQIKKTELDIIQRLNEKYDQSALRLRQAKQLQSELKVLVSSGNKTREEAVRILKREIEVIYGVTAAKQKLASAQAKEKSELNQIRATYDKVYAKEQQLIKSKADLKRLVDAGNISLTKAKKLQTEYAVSLERTNNAAKKQAGFFNSLNEVSRAVSHAWRIILGMYMAERMFGIALSFERTAEKVELLGKKLEFFTKDAQSIDKVTNKAFELGYSIDDLGKIMTRFAITTKGAFSTDEMLNWSESLIKSARATGTTTQELNSTLIQLSQAFSAGRLMGDEYRSISENLPMLKIALEDAFKGTDNAGVGLKKLSSQGLITQDILIQAFQELKQTVDHIPGTINTIDAAIGRLTVAWEKAISGFFKDSTKFKDMFNTLAGMLTYLNGNKDLISLFERDFGHLAGTAKNLSDAIDLLLGFFRGMLVAFSSILKLYPFLIAGTLAYAVANGKLSLSFKSAAAANLAFGASLSKTHKGLLLIAAFSAGWSIGEKLRKEFLVVELAGIAMVNGILKAFNYLETGFDYTVEALKLAWGIFSESLISVLLNPIKQIIALINLIPESMRPDWITDFNSGLSSFVSNMDSSGNAIKEFTTNTDEIHKKFTVTNESIDEGTGALADYAIAARQASDASKNSFVYNTSDVNLAEGNKQLKEMIEDLDPAAKAVSEFETGMNRLWGAFENSTMSMEEFTRIENLLIEQKNKDISKTKQLTDAEKVALKIKEKLASGHDVHRKNIQSAGQALEQNLITYKQYLVYQKTELALSKDVSEQRKNSSKLLKEGRKAYEDFNSAVSKASSENLNLSDSAKWANERVIELAEAFEKGAISADQMSAAFKKSAETSKEMRIRELEISYNAAAVATREYKITVLELKGALENKVITQDQYNKKLNETWLELQKLKAVEGETSEEEQFFGGINKGLFEFANNSKTVFEEMEELTTKAFNSMTDELTEFVTTGKMDFTSLVDSIVKDLTRMAIQKSITEPLAGALFGGGDGGLIGTPDGVGPPTPSSGGLLSDGFDFLSSFFEKGSAFNQGSIVKTYADGGVITQPTIFPMANGAGLMGEAGPEAVMPLKRTSSGELGVATGGNSGGDINIYITVEGTGADPVAMTKSAGQIAQAAGNATSRARRRNG